MAASAAAAIASPSGCGLFFSRGFSGSGRSLKWRKTEKRNVRKAVRGVITAKIELSPPPYSLVWNHDFFWKSMKPGGGGKPSGELLELINRDFGSFEDFVSAFKAAAATQFGSGWAWLVYTTNRLNVGNAVNPRPSDEDKKLIVVKSPNAINPLVWDYSPLLTIDVWEHAYYLDFQNRRPDYISTFMEKLVSWDAVSSRLEAAKARALEREREEEKKRTEYEGADDTNPEAVEMYLESDAEDSEAD
ncbi:UNVERIFIED_CONTAM: Superoxide dismutase [Fe] 2, chloroplastic [Sesamum radiatum]|uniref:superoxide dismutase n=1 Tax=Sesamum radiatum TaxID=300843 RepID=A0AAW2KC33_SESRA